MRRGDINKVGGYVEKMKRRKSKGIIAVSLAGMIVISMIMVVTSTPTPLQNGSFDENLDGWTVDTFGSYNGDVIWDNGRARLRVFRCHSAELYQNFIIDAGDITFDWETKVDQWHESVNYKLLVDGEIKIHKGLTSGYQGHHKGKETIEIEDEWVGKTGRILFYVYPSSHCSADDHENTYLWVDNVSQIAPTPTITPTPTPTISPSPTHSPTITPTSIVPTPTPTPTQAPIGKPQLTISQTTLIEEPEVGEDTLITVTIANTGNGIAKNINLREHIPSSVSINYVDGANSAGNLVTWSGDLDIGQTYSIIHSFRILEEKNRAVPVKVTYEDEDGKRYETSTTIYISAKAEEMPTPAPIPGFKAVFAIAGLLVVAYLLRRGRR